MKKIILFVLFSISLFAHPHTFIEVFPTINVKDSKFSKVHFKWVLDEMTSTILIMELDTNGDGKISEKENKYVFNNYFSIMQDYNYYTQIVVDSKIITLKGVKNFKATIENHKVCYSFDIKRSFNIKNTVFEFGDTDFYVAMVLKDSFVDVEGASFTTAGVDNDFYYGYRLELR